MRCPVLTPADIPRMEDALTEAGSSVDSLCETADVNRSTWTRWKSGVSKPLWAKWEDVCAAFTRLTEGRQ